MNHLYCVELTESYSMKEDPGLTQTFNTYHSYQYPVFTPTIRNLHKLVSAKLSLCSSPPAQEHRQSCLDFSTFTTMFKANSSPPAHKEIVLSVMSFVKKKTKLTNDEETGNEVSKLYLHYRCPKPRCSKPIIILADKSGFNIPFPHVQSCYGRGGRAKLP